MYGVPPDLDLAPLVGARVINIGLGMHNTLFTFEIGPLDYGGVNAEGQWDARDADEVLGIRTRDAMRLSAVPFDRLLGSTVTGFAVEPPAYFDLMLSTGISLRFYDDSEQYESFTVDPGGYVI